MKVLLLLLIFNLSFANKFDEIEFFTEEYPPYNFKENQDLKGIAIDILELVLKKLGSNKSKNDIKYMPWIRAYNIAQTKGLKNVVFSTTRTGPCCIKKHHNFLSSLLNKLSILHFRKTSLA